METTKKIVKYVKDSVSNISGILTRKNGEVELLQSKEPISWSDNNETVIIKKTDYEAIQSELYNQTEIIKKFKVKEEEYRSIAQDYEETLTMFLNKNKPSVEPSRINSTNRLESFISKYEDEITKLKSTEERYKSHVQALKRDLLKAEEKAENAEDFYEQKLETIIRECEDYKAKIKDGELRISELMVENKDLKDKLESRCADLLEVIEYCRFLFK